MSGTGETSIWQRLIGRLTGATGPGRDALLRAVVEESPDSLLVTAADGSFVYANDAFHRLFPKAQGRAATLAEVASMIGAVEEGTPGLSSGEFERLMASAAAAVADHAEVPLRTAGGGVEWRRISVLPLTSVPGYVQWRAEDVTARREVDAVRHREEERLADLLDNLPAAFFSADGEGRILYANKALADCLEITADELASRTRRFADFVVDGEAAPVEVSDGSPELHGEVTLRRADGSTFRACLLQSENIGGDGREAYTRSILLRHMAWLPEEGSEQRLHWLFDEAPVGIALLNLHGDTTDCNRAFLKLMGLHREAVVGRPFSHHLAKEDRAEVASQLSKIVMGALPAAVLEVRLPGGGHRELVASLYASRMENHDGEITGLVLHFIDTTEQKHLEVQFAQSQKMQAVGQLAGGVAHDFNNLLTAMIGFSDLLLGRHGPEDPSFADIMQIKQNANRATNLVRQLLAFSRQQTLRPEVIDVTEALADLSNLLSRLIGETIELKMEPGRDAGLIRVDRGQFDQVIINMVVNARDAMPGGGTITIRTANVTIDVPTPRGHDVIPPGDYLQVDVMDTGVGIAQEDLDHIFEPFFSTKEVGSGTGLGLSTVYGIVHQTDGYIFVDSAPGEGTTFSLYLPLVAAEPALDVAAEFDHKAQLAASKKRPDLTGDAADLTGVGTVLLVEDEGAVRMFGARALRNKGYKVLEAIDGESAFDVINGTDETIDLIISDVVMPGMDGHTLVQLVRQELPDVKVILMSGYAEDVLAEDIERDDTIHFLPKPFSLADLAGKVKEVMD